MRQCAVAQDLLRLFGLAVRASSELRKIGNLEDWSECARPRGGLKQWVPLRSAYELARAWCGDDGPIAAPEPFLRLLTHPQLEGLQLSEGYAEHETPLRGEGG